MPPIDLRSDTVTHPTPAMRAAMAAAPVGDDVYGEDPTVNRLQNDAAVMLGKDAALFVSSGTQGNLTAILSHCGRGDEMILARDSHVFKYEVASAAAYGGVQPLTLPIQADGTMRLGDIADAFRDQDDHSPETRLICVENTQAGAWGAPLSADYIDSVGALARTRGVKLHVDGARLFNASAALRTPVAALVNSADSVTVCLSKGLCAPVGSLLAGSREFIARARKIRKSLGGGMRQVGILAAAGLIALHEMSRWERLQEDHDNATALAEGLSTVPGVDIDLSRVKTNMIFFALTPDVPISVGALAKQLALRGILANPYKASERRMRMVTHHDFKRADVPIVVDAVRGILAGTTSF